MTLLQRLFTDLEFAPREHILDVPFEVAGVRPAGASHSIYEELWHLDDWQTFVLRMARGQAVRKEYSGTPFPSSPAPQHEEEWRELVKHFLEGSNQAAALAGDLERLELPLADGPTVRERLELLAVHNAHHLGKIILLRQLLGAWTPPEDG
jgi:uncharacterized damage-inducible protein DinB